MCVVAVARRICHTEVEARGLRLVSLISVEDAEFLLLDKTSAFRAWMVQTLLSVSTLIVTSSFRVVCVKGQAFYHDPEEYPPLHPLPQII